MTLIRTILAAVCIVASTSIAFAAASAWPEAEWPTVTPAEAGMDAAALAKARDYALQGGGSGLIVRGGRAVFRWGDPKATYDLKSSTKALASAAVGLALADGKFKSLDDPARKYHPTLGVPPESNAATGWLDKITLAHLATQTAGFAKPGGFTELQFEPGTKWLYSDGGPNWLAECVTLVYRRDLKDLLFERVFTPIGITPADLVYRNNSYRPHEIDGIPRREFGSGFTANVDAMARIGLLYLRGGRWKDRQLLPQTFVDAVRTVPESLRNLPVVDADLHGQAARHYGLLWWNNADGTLKDVPTDAYWSWGLYDSLTAVIPSLDLVIARAGKSFKFPEGGGHYDKLAPFLGVIAKSVRGPMAAGAGAAEASGKPASEKPAPEAATSAAVPPSPVIKAIAWAPPAKILRLAKGSDNWPITWMDDGSLFTAYGDGNGFEPFLPKKLSLGLARVTGVPPDVRGENVRSADAEAVGNDRRGRKASGMLMVYGVLYMLARNTGNAQLAVSRDRGATWTWADWKFTASFGCPTFVNFGRNYAGARDGYVYMISQDADSAYDRADRFVLARVPKGDIAKREAWEFFKSLDADGRPVWTADVAARGGVLTDPGRCYRAGVAYCAPLKRYFMAVPLPGTDIRLPAGLTVYDAPEPWGPWTVAFRTDTWDVAPGETASFPPPWMSPDGRTLHLLFSGDDSFSVRRAEVMLAEGAK